MRDPACPAEHQDPPLGECTCEPYTRGLLAGLQADRAGGIMLTGPDALEHPGLVEWLVGGQRGASSNALVEFLVDRSATGFPSWPADSSDLRRCEMLLRAVTTLRPLLPMAAGLSVEWGALIDDWDDLVGLLPTGPDGDLLEHGTSETCSARIAEITRTARATVVYLDAAQD